MKMMMRMMKKQMTIKIQMRRMTESLLKHLKM
jgi:hypothetical protein